MAKKWKVYVRPQAVFEVMKSTEMQAALRDAGEKIAQRAGSDYKATVNVGTKRAAVTVSPDSYRAYYDNLKNNTLLKALGAGK